MDLRVLHTLTQTINYKQRMTLLELNTHLEVFRKTAETLKEAKKQIKVTKHDDDALLLVLDYDKLIFFINSTLSRTYTCEL